MVLIITRQASKPRKEIWIIIILQSDINKEAAEHTASVFTFLIKVNQVVLHFDLLLTDKLGK